MPYGDALQRTHAILDSVIFRADRLKDSHSFPDMEGNSYWEISVIGRTGRHGRLKSVIAQNPEGCFGLVDMEVL